MQKESIRLHINGQIRETEVEPNKLLLDVLRQDLGLTGSKRGCGDSSCGDCTVLVDGEPQMSCLMLAVSYQDHEITTIEGVADGSELDPIQRGFSVEGGAYCGYGVVTILYSGQLLNAMYDIPNVKFDGYRVLTNKPACGAMRGHGTVNTRFAFEPASRCELRLPRRSTAAE